jgi:hypothetical protein
MISDIGLALKAILNNGMATSRGATALSLSFAAGTDILTVSGANVIAGST